VEIPSAVSQLTLHDRITISARPEEVWLFLEDPDMVKEWNEKLRAWEPLSHGSPRLGFRYRARFGMRGRETDMEGEVVEYRPPVRLVTRFTGGRLPADGYSELAFDLSDRVHSTRLHQTIVMQNAGIPWFFRWLIWFIHHTGRTVGKSHLQRLKELVEEAVTQAADPRTRPR